MNTNNLSVLRKLTNTKKVAMMLMSSSDFAKLLERVAQREEADDHLTTEERSRIVNEYLRRHPEEAASMTEDLDDNFVRIIF